MKHLLSTIWNLNQLISILYFGISDLDGKYVKC